MFNIYLFTYFYIYFQIIFFTLISLIIRIFTVLYNYVKEEISICKVIQSLLLDYLNILASLPRKTEHFLHFKLRLQVYLIQSSINFMKHIILQDYFFINTLHIWLQCFQYSYKFAFCQSLFVNNNSNILKHFRLPRNMLRAAQHMSTPTIILPTITHFSISSLILLPLILGSDLRH
jgi:hypothetical protein